MTFFAGILINTFKKKWKSPAWVMALVLSLFTLTFYNFSLWLFLFSKIDLADISNWPFFLGLYFMAFALLNILFNLFLLPKIGKIILSILFILNSALVYFMATFKIVFDKNMMLNVIGTDLAEAKELITLGLILSIIFLGFVPVIFLWKKIEIDYHSFLKEMKTKTTSIALSFFLIFGTFLVMNKKFTFFFRSNRVLKHYLVPLNYLDASRVLFSNNTMSEVVLLKISEDALLDSSWQKIKNKTIVVLVLGETARYKNFSVNGYQRNTNPYLSKEDIISFKNAYSCGTATAVSLPCMFSHKSKVNFEEKDIYQYENLLDFYKKAGFSVYWRDNNTGCKGVCDRVNHQELRHLEDKKLCLSDVCWDEIMLQDLDKAVESGGDKILIVMHQLGSHGPAYNKHCPPEFHQFPNSCNKKQLIDCSKEQVTSAYDNTILYTDYFLGKTINFLKNYKEANTAMIYLSDHGESLGENGVYLHGLPYMIAPEEQIHIPFILWLSPHFVSSFKIDKKCLNQLQNEKISHDNLFHSMLGLVNINTSYLDNSLNIFSACRVGDH